MCRYPDNWKVPPDQLDGIYEFVADRARLAHEAGKPFVMEEYGMQVHGNPIAMLNKTVVMHCSCL